MNKNYMMNRFVNAVLSAGLVLTFSACAQKVSDSSAAGQSQSAETGSETSGEGEMITIGDAMKKDAANAMSRYTEEEFIYVFEYEGKPVRVTAEMTKEVYEQLEAVASDDRNRDQKIADAVAGLKIKEKEDLSDDIPTQEDLDSLKGRKGQELLDEGYIVQGIGFDENNNASFVVNKDIFQLNIEAENLPEVSSHPDETALFAECTVKKAEFVTITWNAVDPQLK